MTHASLTMDLFLQLLRGGLHNRNATAISAPFDCEISPCEYQSNAAATRISFTNSVGDKRRAERTPSGTSNVTVAIVTSCVQLCIPQTHFLA